MKENSIDQTVARITAASDLDTAVSESEIDVPEALRLACERMSADTGEVCRRITCGQTAARIVPAAELPAGVSLVDWHHCRLFGVLPPTWPRPLSLPAEDCYLLHIPGNAIVAERWFKEHGWSAASESPFRLSVLLPPMVANA